MKYLPNICLTLLFILLGTHALNAQNIDQERMQRDLNIMESVLEEMFKSEWSTEDGTGTLTSVKMHTNGLSWSPNKSSSVEGSYFTDYGTTFMVTGSRPIMFNFKSNKKATGYFSSADNNKSERVEINRESIVNRISDFLMDYGSTIKQLESNDKVTVVYKANNIDQLLTIVKNDTLDRLEPDSIPSVSVSATVHDLQSYRKGQINESSFSERLHIKDINTKDDSERKLRIMSKILQTSFDDDQPDNFEIKDVNHFYLDGFGAIFESKASYGSGLFGLGIAFSKIRDRLKKIAISDSVSVSISDDKFSWSSDDDTEDKTPEEIEAAYENFISTLKETMVDYGGTLSSVQSNENILVSLSLSAGDIVPDRVDLRIKKSVLESLDSGSISRKQAMEEVTVKEY